MLLENNFEQLFYTKQFHHNNSQLSLYDMLSTRTIKTNFIFYFSRQYAKAVRLVRIPKIYLSVSLCCFEVVIFSYPITQKIAKS